MLQANARVLLILLKKPNKRWQLLEAYCRIRTPILYADAFIPNNGRLFERMKFVKKLLEALVYTTVLFIPFAWILRDGLGPDTAESSGFNAVYRCFMTFYLGPILIGLLALSFWVRKKNVPDK